MCTDAYREALTRHFSAARPPAPTAALDDAEPSPLPSPLTPCPDDPGAAPAEPGRVPAASTRSPVRPGPAGRSPSRS